MRSAIIPVALLLAILSSAQASNSTVNFQICLQNVTNPTSPWYNSTGGRSITGDNLTSLAGASAISYALCLEACGPGTEPFDWAGFSQQFSAWLLPWLALISQLPFGARFGSENMMSAILTVGSPTLAGYSLALTALNERWAVRILTNLQQTHIKITSTGGLLASLVVLPENDKWWDTLSKSLSFKQTWSISAATSIAWVVIAYLFTVIDSFIALLGEASYIGQAVGFLWVWLLPIVVGWLQISPKCNMDLVEEAIKAANEIAYVASKSTHLACSTMESTDTQPLYPRHTTSESIPLQPIAQSSHDPESSHSPDGLSSSPPAAVLSDGPKQAFFITNSKRCSAPIYNYTRFLSWVVVVNEVSNTFHHASHNAQEHMPVHASAVWKKGEDGGDNRRGYLEEVESYCSSKRDRTDAGIPHPPSPWGSETFSRMFVAAGMALFPQWGTAGAAVISAWFTPTIGCRSLTYLLYACTSTIVWVIMVLSSVLAHYADAKSEASPDSEALLRQEAPKHMAATLSTILRRSGKLLATLNAIGIILICIFQFSNGFDSCFCNSSIFWLGTQKGYNVINFSGSTTISGMKTAWLGSIFMALAAAFGFMLFVYMFLNRYIAILV